MSIQESTEEYRAALRLGQKQYKELTGAGLNPYPQVLDDILQDASGTIQDIGLVEIPSQRIIGVKSVGRTRAFTADFLPLMNTDTEFAFKWIHLCDDHLSDEGIRDPIECFEYLGNFYVQEGNKRVSVLRYFGAPTISSNVQRIVPPLSEEPRIKAYYEFMDFYKDSGLYTVQFQNPGDYAKLLSFLGKESGEKWNSREQKTFSAYFQYFRDAFDALNAHQNVPLDSRPEDALLLWLKLYPFQDLGRLSGTELKKTLASLWEDVASVSDPDSLVLQTVPSPTPKNSIISRIIAPNPNHLTAAFIYPRDPESSPWVKAHNEGRIHLAQALGDSVTTLSYFHADTPETAEFFMEAAVQRGADIIFTTTPQLGISALKIAVQHPKVRFLNCSVYLPYSSVRTYYCRIYEAKFITGAIAGAMSKNGHIGYVGFSPIFGVPASINAFALGAQLTNPSAQIDLRWSCLPGNHMKEFIEKGIRVISNRDVPTANKTYLEHGSYGTYLLDDQMELKPLGSPVWLWGNFYENVIRSIMDGSWEDNKTTGAVNYWWGMDSNVIDVELSDEVPEGVRSLAEILRSGMRRRAIDPFHRKIRSQDGTLINDGTHSFSPDELLHMDWLCENVDGYFPTYDEILPFAQPLVREMGVFQEQIPTEKEGTL